MFSALLLAYPDIDPVIFQIGPFALRWYALAYIGGVLLGWLLVRRLNRTPVPGLGHVVPESALDDLVPWAIGGIILGGRLGYVLFYKPVYYLENPGEILQIWGGGMSYHGGLLGMFAAMAILSLRRGMKYFALMDLLAVAAPIGLFLGRMANFVNGELYGHPTDVAWAMVFPTDPSQLPRHPSQLYEAALEGIALFLLLLWMGTRTRARHRLGMISAFYLLGYSAARIAAEFFRLPDDHLGTLALGLTMGQWLSLPLIALGLFLLWKSLRPSALPGTFSLGTPHQPPPASGGRLSSSAYANGESLSSPPPARGGRPGGGSGQVSPLAAILRERILSEGPLSLADYMQACLTHPQHGYYVTRDPLGKAGDFTTSPEISQLFGELIGLWLVERWQSLGAPPRFHLIEAGPGRGTLMADALRAARLRPAFLDAMNLHLVEASPALREKQKSALAPLFLSAERQPRLPLPPGGGGSGWGGERAEHQRRHPPSHPPPSGGGGDRLAHHAGLSTVPGDAPWLFVANEFFDALPIRQFVRREEGWHERMVGWSEGFAWTEAPSSWVPRENGDPVGAIREACEPACAVMRRVASRIAAQGGAALIVDYGGEGGRGDTFQAVQVHGYADPFAAPGEADLTAHVDFAALADAARQAGAQAAPLATQGAWLRALGGDMLLRRHLARADGAQAESLRNGWARLADPAGMGTLFKVLEISS